MAAFIIKMSDDQEREYTVVAERVKVPEKTEIGWNTTVKFDDGIDAYATIDGKYILLSSGLSIKECFKASVGRAPTITEQLRKPVINLYACRQIIDGCVIGCFVPFVDVEDGEKKVVSSFWNYSLEVADTKKLIQQVANEKDKAIDVETCSDKFRESANLGGLLEAAIGSRLANYTVPQTRAMNVQIATEVINTYIKTVVTELPDLILHR